VRAVPSLFVIRGNDQGVRLELDAEALLIGRDPTNPVQLHDTEVSRRHAELRREGRQYELVDLSSSNGTFVNGQRIDRHTLASGDQIQIGATLLLYTGASDDSSANLTRTIAFDGPQTTDSSRIIRAMSQEEGSRVFDPGFTGAESPWLARARSNLQIMYRTALAVSHTLDIDQLLGRIMELIFEWVEADRGCVMLVDPVTKKLQPKVRRDARGSSPEAKITISQTILDYVIQRNEGVLTTNAREDNRWSAAASILQQGIREAICVPLQARYDVVGLIYIDTFTPPERALQQKTANKFTEEHLKLMIAIAHQAALAVEDTRYYSAMVQAERLAAVGQTIATLSHHIKNILQGVRGGSYLIEMGLADHQEAMVRKGWDIVERNQKKISALVLDMLTFSKDREPELTSANLNETVSDVVDLMRTRAEELGVELTYHPATDMPVLTFDPEGIHRAALNVVTNAIDACDKEEHGRVGVSTEYLPAEGLARVVVEDNGAGIAPDDVEKIFTLFVSHKGGRGTGLGLPVSQKIVKEHGGQILVDSEVGRGSRFTLELPAVPPEAASYSKTIIPGHE